MLTPIEMARDLRRQMTPEEKKLWAYLRAHRFNGLKFRRQHPIIFEIISGKTHFYVADFYCHQKKFVVELDGKVHEFLDQKIYDSDRDTHLKEKGLKVLRIKNSEMQNIEDVLNKIERFLSP